MILNNISTHAHAHVHAWVHVSTLTHREICYEHEYICYLMMSTPEIDVTANGIKFYWI